MGSGNTVKFWLDVWVGRESLKTLYPSLYDICNCKDAVVADMGGWQQQGWSWSWWWTADLPQNEAQNAIDLRELLMGITPKRNTDDVWCWMLDTIKGFSVKSCYVWLCSVLAGTDDHIDEDTAEACKMLWKNDIPSKAAIFSWRILLQRIATRETLHKRGVLVSERDLCCVFCFKEVETLSHLLCTCETTKEIWSRVYGWLGLNASVETDMVADFRNFGKHFQGRRRRGVKHLIWIAVVWNVWNARNKVLFKGEVADVKSIVNAIMYTSWGWFIARKGHNCGVNVSDWLVCPMGCLLSV